MDQAESTAKVIKGINWYVLYLYNYYVTYVAQDQIPISGILQFIVWFPGPIPVFNVACEPAWGQG